MGLTLVVDDPIAIYSGMVPGFVAGQYARHELEIDVRRLAARAGARLIEARALRVDPRRRQLELEGHPTLTYDLASLDVGSSVAGLELPGVREHALSTRPMVRFVRRMHELIDRARVRLPGRPFRAVVVGAGAGGVELGLCLERRLAREGAGPVEMSLLEAGTRILAGAPSGLVRRVQQLAAARGIRLSCGARVQAVEPGQLRLEGDQTLPFEALLWVTGAVGVALVRDSELPQDERGFVRVRSTFEVVGHDGLLAVGDCATFEAFPDLPKAGVHAVRSGRVLDHNLRARLRGERLRAYRPQRDFLTLLNLGDGTALGAKWGISFRGRWAMRWKDHLDRRFVEAFQ